MRPLLITTILLPLSLAAADTEPMLYIPAEVDFSDTLQVWDGFGFNYVEAPQTRDYEASPQDYGGFSLLNERQKAEIIELVFGEEGLDVDLVKMFLDPWQQKEPGGSFDHETTTANMMEFVLAGHELMRERGVEDLEIITTLYGPPPWATAQKFIGGRDLDPAMAGYLEDYMLEWVLYLRSKDLNVRHLSIHNEGEDFYRWNYEDGTQRLREFDYNMYWPPELVNEFVISMHDKIESRGIKGLGVTNGEPSNWTRFYQWGYAKALYTNDEALNKLGILTTHGFVNGDWNRLSFGSINGKTTEMLRRKRPDLRAWVTSYSWEEMDADFIKMAHEHIYIAGVNALIPWAGIQHGPTWIDGDPNPGTAIRVRDDGAYEVTRGYYLYKQLTQAGRRGMKVASTMMANPVSNIIAFDSNGTDHPDAFVVTDTIFVWGRPFEIKIKGTPYTRFAAYRTNMDGTEQYTFIGEFTVEEGRIIYDAPQGTVTTFIGVQ